MIDRFILGTAQFGSNYGITNTTGQPTQSEIFEILDMAYNYGIRTFDTALAYGDAAKRLGQWHKDRQYNIELISKFSIVGNLDQTKQDIVAACKQLYIEKFDALLVHDPCQISKIDINALKDFFIELKESGITRKIGISCYDVIELQDWLSVLPCDVVQCPVNIFDQRFLQAEILQLLREHKVALHVRSIFLQGVLLADKLPNRLSKLQSSWDKYNKVLQAKNMPRLQACLAFINSVSDRIDKAIFGVNNTAELQQISAGYANTGSCDIDFAELAVTDVDLVDPRKWPV